MKPPATHFLASSAPEEGAGRPAAALFGAPLDLTESFRSGAGGGPAAVRAMSDSLESYSARLDRDLEDLLVVDLGDLDFGGNEDDVAGAVEQIAAAMDRAVSTACLGVMIGGEHTGSLGGYRGVKRQYPDAMVLQVDAHLDLRDGYDGLALTHATWLYQAGQEFGFENIVQVGLRSGERAEWQRARSRTAWSGHELEIPPLVRQRLAAKPVYLSIDIDVLDPAHAPGTGCPEPGGVTFRELQAFLYSLAGLQVVGMDVMEVAPSYEPANITAAAAAKLIREGILLFGSPSPGR